MSAIILTAALAAILAGCSLWAAARYRAFSRLPMQWSFSGRVTWSAPRGIALAFTPVLATLVVGGAAFLLAARPPRADGAHAGLGALAFVAACFVAAHVFHLWLIERTVTRR